MKIRTLTTLAAIALCGTALTSHARQPRVAADVYAGKTPQEAARALLDIALAQAGKGSWERIAIARVYYLGGFKPEGQAIFDAVLRGKHEDSDLFRIARIYQEAGEWDKARPLFDRYAAANPREENDLAEIGAYYLLNGDRAGAERLFGRSFEIEPDEWATAAAAGAYLGVTPQQ